MQVHERYRPGLMARSSLFVNALSSFECLPIKWAVSSMSTGQTASLNSMKRALAASCPILEEFGASKYRCDAHSRLRAEHDSVSNAPSTRRWHSESECLNTFRSIPTLSIDDGIRGFPIRLLLDKLVAT